MTQTGYRRTLPVLTDQNRHFWTGGAHGELLIQRCDACGYWLHPPGPRCRQCGSAELTPRATSGQGVVESFTINEKQWGPGMEVPYAVLAVRLVEQEDLWLTSKLVGADPRSVKIGMSVSVVFEQDQDVWLPMFTPAAT